MNVLKLKEVLIDDYEKIIHLLNALEFENIKYNSKLKEIRFSREYGKNPTGAVIKLNEELYYHCYSTNEKGDVISLVQNKMQCDFREALTYICSELKLDKTQLNQKIKVPFGGFYKQILKSQSIDDIDYKIYPESILDDYISNPYKVSQMFYNDGIYCNVQEQYKIGYDLSSMRITIPWRSPNGDLIGITARYNGDDYESKGISKYLSLVGFQKSQTLFGFSNNYQSLVGRTVFIAEAEKSVMQANSVGINNVLAVGCHNISNVQVRYIKSLFPKNIVISFDEGVSKEEIIEQCEKFKNSHDLFKYKIGYVLDEDNTYMQKDSKKSPFDFAYDTKQILTNCINWI